MHSATPPGTAAAESVSRRGADALPIALLLAAICAPTLDQLLRPASVRSVQVEFREPAPRPVLALERAPLLAYPGQFNQWYGDSFGLRDKLIRWHNLLYWFRLGLSPTDQLV